MSFLSSLMTLATMDEEEVSKVIVTDSIPANGKRGRMIKYNCVLVKENFFVIITNYGILLIQYYNII